MAQLNSESAYRQAAANGATQIGLVLIAYDALAADLFRAGEAVHQGDIAGRCRHSNHGLLLLGHLETWVNFADSEAVASSLRQFYTFLRSSTLALQQNGRPEEFGELAKLVAETSVAWRCTEQRLIREKGVNSASKVLVFTPDNGAEARPRASAWSA